ncbi:hypothetical protein WJX77_004709 [Trebouxia sp. C0004]
MISTCKQTSTTVFKDVKRPLLRHAQFHAATAAVWKHTYPGIKEDLSHEASSIGCWRSSCSMAVKLPYGVLPKKPHVSGRPAQQAFSTHFHSAQSISPHFRP